MRALRLCRVQVQYRLPQASVPLLRARVLAGILKPEPNTVGEGAALYYRALHAPRGRAARRLYSVDNEKCRPLDADSAIRRSIRILSDEVPGSESGLLQCPPRPFECQMGQFENTNINKYLEENFDHDHVLFVQHPLEKGPSRGVRGGSFVACAEVLGNCDLATEGGIPRSSR